MRIAIKNKIPVLLLLILAGCGEPALFDRFNQVENGWHKDSVMTFEVPVEDTTASYYVSMKLRHDADYQYSNLYVFRTIRSENGIEHQDTVDLTIADDHGKWLGNGVGEIKTMAWGYDRRGLRFTNRGKYTFTLQHGMRDTVLDGVLDVGLTIDLLEEK